MELPNKGLSELFEQLGLPSSEEDIEHFLANHSLSPNMRLVDAPFWTPVQAAFLKEQFQQDAEWAPVVDELNVRLHGE